MNKTKGTAYVKNFKRRISKKVEDVVEDASYISKTLQELATKIGEKSQSVVEDTNLVPNDYEDFYNYLERVSDKLFEALNIITPLFDEATDVQDTVPKEEPLSLAEDGCSSSGRSDIVVDESALQTALLPNPPTALASSAKSNGPHEGEPQPLVNSQLKLPDVFSQAFEKSLDSVFSACEQNANAPEQNKNDFNEKPKVPSSSSFYSASSNFPLGNSSNSVENNSQNCERRHSSVSSDAAPPSMCLHDSAMTLQSNVSSLSGSEEDCSPIPPPQVSFGCEYPAAVATNVTSPSDFWVQLKTPDESKILYNLEKTFYSLPENGVEYFLAPSNRSHKFQRARLIDFRDTSEIKDEESVKVLFVDFGFSESVRVCDLRRLPMSSVKYPIQAIPCRLYGIVPVGDDWSESAIEEFHRVFEHPEYQITVIFKHREQFLVTMTVTLQLPDCNETETVADMLCFLEFACRVTDFNNESMANMGDGNYLPNNSEQTNEESVRQPYLNACSQNQNTCETFVRKNCSNVKNSFIDHQEANTGSNNKASSASYQEPTQLQEKLAHIPRSSEQDVLYRSESSASSQIISNEVATPESTTSSVDRASPSKIDTPFDWTLTVSEAVPIFMPQSGKWKFPPMLVSICAVENPSHFYVNVVSDNLVELDDLREQMTQFYSNCRRRAEEFNMFQLEAGDLNPGMFCSSYYEMDRSWYRAKIEDIIGGDNSAAKKVKVHYIDYGERSLQDPKDLYPLTPKFALKPAFALSCSLAGIFPKIPEDEGENDSHNVSINNNGWSFKAIEIFEAFAKHDKFLVAEVVGKKMLGNSSLAYDVLLWGNIDEKDYMINNILLDENLAFEDVSLKRAGVVEEDTKSEEEFQTWDPLADEHDSALNSYGVNMSDLEVQSVGYKANDEKVFCKFFSRLRRCPRGNKCPYVHTYENLKDGATRDKVGIFLVDNHVTLPDSGSQCLVQISYVIDPGHFFIMFPYGTRGVVDNAESNECIRKEFELLGEEMTKYYSSTSFDDNTIIALSNGTIVAAKSSVDGSWCRARITDVGDVDDYAEVFYIDHGGTEIVPRKNIRKIKEQFLFCPFQAVEAFLANVVPKGKTWSQHAKSTFVNAVKSKVFLATILEKIGSSLYVILKGTSKPNDIIINDMLVSHGFAIPTPENDILHSASNSKREIRSCNPVQTHPG